MAACRAPEPEAFLPLGTTPTPPPEWQSECTPLRTPRPYVQACGKASLALSFADRVTVGPLLCGSWNCPSCRKIESARLLDRLRRGMESRPELHRILLTLTIDPSKFDAVPVGVAHWDAKNNRTTKSRAQRTTTLWSGPNPAAFEEAAAAMSDEWNKLNDRLGRKAARAKAERHGYFRVVELHRNGWPHYHVVIEHPTWTAADIEPQVRGWGLGTIVHAADMSLGDAIGEVAPYLVSSEKGNGSKAYQFAASALPEGFRLHSSSRGFLAPAREPEEASQHSIVLTGYPVEHAKPLREYGAKTVLVLPDARPAAPNPPPISQTPPPPPRYRPRSLVAFGDGAKLYYAARFTENDLLEALEVPPDQLPY